MKPATPPAAAPGRSNPRCTGPGRLTARDTAELPSRLLDAAQAVFLEMGYARATMDAIARAAGTTRKTLYARHAGKAEVLSALVDRWLAAALAPAAPSDAGALPVQPRDQLLRLGRELAALSAGAEVAGLNRLMFAEAFRVPELAQVFTRLYERAVDHVAARLIAVQSAGALPPMRDPRLTATIFIEMVASLPRLQAMLGRPMARRQVDALVVEAVDILLGAGGARRRAAARP